MYYINFSKLTYTKCVIQDVLQWVHSKHEVHDVLFYFSLLFGEQ